MSVVVSPMPPGLLAATPAVRGPAGNVILVVYLAPVGIAAMAPRILGERVSARTLLALAPAPPALRS